MRIYTSTLFCYFLFYYYIALLYENMILLYFLFAIKANWDILVLVKASNTVHATSKEMKTDELTIKKLKQSSIQHIGMNYYNSHIRYRIGFDFIFLTLLYDNLQISICYSMFSNCSSRTISDSFFESFNWRD